jgi:PAS domain S-box-containing protein
MKENFRKEQIILLIDDDKVMHRMIQHVVEKAQFKFLSAYSGRVGLETIFNEKPDLVLLDYMMPEMDGHQVYQELISNAIYADCRDIPIIILTAADTKDDVRDTYLALGISAYLTKPFGSSELINVIKNILSTNRLQLKNKEFLEFTRRAKDFLENLIASSPDAIITLDEEGRFTFFSSGAEKMFGYEANSIQGELFADYCSSPLTLEAIFEQLKSEGKICHMEMKFRADDGRKIPVSFSFSTVQDKSEELIGYLGIAKDLSEIKRLEKELIEKERLAALMETTAAINHEINNPLTPILGNVQLILAEGERLDPDIRLKLEIIEKNAWRVHEIIKKLERITRPIATTYCGDIKMLDIKNSD